MTTEGLGRYIFQRYISVMPINLKFKDEIEASAREEVLRSLVDAGFHPRQLFPKQTRPRLRAIYALEGEGTTAVAAVREALRAHADAIDYVESMPKRYMK